MMTLIAMTLKDDPKAYAIIQYDTFELSKLPSASVLSGSGPQLKNAGGEMTGG